MIKDLVRKEILWLGPEADGLLGDDILKSESKFHGRNFALKSERLEEVVNLLIRKHGVTGIIETGTCNGMGTTLTYAKTGLPVQSCEAHKQRYLTALDNLSSYQNVELNHAFTTQASEIAPEYGKNLGERNLPSRENWLAGALSGSKGRESILVSLDSGGDVGLCEANVLLRWIEALTEPKTIVLILDDIRFVKHERTIPLLEQKFGAHVYQVEDRWGFTVIHVGKALPKSG